MRDGAKRIFLNTKGKDEENISGELKWMLRYFEETTDEVAEASKCRRIQKMNEIVKEIKASAEFDRKVRDRLEELGRAERKGIEQGLEQGLEIAHMEDARGMKAEGVALDTIRRVTGLSLETIAAL